MMSGGAAVPYRNHGSSHTVTATSSQRMLVLWPRSTVRVQYVWSPNPRLERHVHKPMAARTMYCTVPLGKHNTFLVHGFRGEVAVVSTERDGAAQLFVHHGSSGHSEWSTDMCFVTNLPFHPHDTLAKPIYRNDRTYEYTSYRYYSVLR